MNIGDTVAKSDYTKYAIWCNSNNAHIEIKDGAYVVVENETTTETTADKIAKLDAEFAEAQAEYVNAIGVANLTNDSELIAELQEEYAEILADYKTAREELDAE